MLAKKKVVVGGQDRSTGDLGASNDLTTHLPSVAYAARTKKSVVSYTSQRTSVCIARNAVMHRLTNTGCRFVTKRGFSASAK
mmetsp:Transcript_72226/g.139592  ORF Transcript_72226/g.139592 Transcript_72226/m.139592 type:complete len:82 (-) Transcript_72226:933-1178(-)